MAFSGAYAIYEKDGRVVLEVGQVIDTNGWTPSVLNNSTINVYWSKAFTIRAQTKFPTSP